MAATLTTIAPVLKEVYEGRIREQLNNEVKTLKRITKTSDRVTNETGGKYVTFPIHTRRNQGIGSRREMGVLPAPGQQGTAAARVGLKYAYGGVQLTGQAISLADTDSKAFARTVQFEMDGLKNDLLKDMNRQVYGVGDGAVAVASGANTTVTIPVKDTRLVQVGMVLDSQTGTTVDNTGLVVTAVNPTALTITVAVAPGTALAANDILVRTGSGKDATSEGTKEITGFDAIIGTGDLYNITVASEPEWQSTINANSGTPRALSEGLMISMADAIRTKGGKTTVIFQSLGVRRSYFNLLSQLRQVVNEQKFTGGFTGLAFTTDDGEIPVVADIDAPPGKQYFVNEDTLTFYRDEEWHFLDRDGNMWKQVRDSSGAYDAWYAHMVEYHELGCDRRNSNGILADIIES